jgi:hypothetical protein
MHASIGGTDSSYGVVAMSSPSQRQKLWQAARNELRLVIGVALKVGVALLLLEGLAWIGAAVPQRDAAVLGAATPAADPSRAAVPASPVPGQRGQTSLQ